MIDITPFQQRLNLLKCWLSDRIDGIISPPIWEDTRCVSFNYTVDEVLRIYEQVGVMVFEDDVINNPALPFSFEEYCKYKSELNDNNSRILQKKG